MAEQDFFGQEIPPDDVDELPPDEQGSADTSSEDTPPEEAIDASGTPPADPAQAHKYWQAAYTKSRQKDRERYASIEQEHRQYKELLARFYDDDAYAQQVLRQRFPHLATGGQGSGQGATAPQTAAPSGLVGRLKQHLGEFGFLADGIGQALEGEIEARVQQRVGPVEQRLGQQTAAARQAEETKLLAEMDQQYPGWEDTYGDQMKALDEFLASDALTHPTFGSKYALYYRLLNPDTARIEATRAMQAAARQRTSLGRSGPRATPSHTDLVRKASSNAEAFQLAARAALEDSA